MEYNHFAEFHLSGFDLEEVLEKKFDILITSSYNFTAQNKRCSNKELTDRLIDLIEKCLNEEANAIIVSDSYARIFEYMTMLEQIIIDTPILKKNTSKFDSEKSAPGENPENNITIKKLSVFYTDTLDHY